MSEIKIQHASALKSGGYILVDGDPCIIRDIQTSRPGKHGHAKVRIKASSILTGSNKEVVKPGHDNVEVPVITKKHGQILTINGDDIELMDMETYENILADRKYAEESIRDSIDVGQTVLFWDVTGKILIKQIIE